MQQIQACPALKPVYGISQALVIFAMLTFMTLGSFALQVEGHLEKTKLILVTVLYDKCCYPKEVRGSLQEN